MNEDVLAAAVGCNKTKSLSSIEPLYDSLHCTLLDTKHTPLSQMPGRRCGVLRYWKADFGRSAALDSPVFVNDSLQKREAKRNSARAASVLLKSSPKKRIRSHDIPPSLRMSGQSCTNRDSRS